MAEGEVDLEVVEEISEETGLYLRESGGEAKDCLILDTVVMGEAEEGVGAATDWKLSLPQAARHLISQCFDFMPEQHEWAQRHTDKFVQVAQISNRSATLAVTRNTNSAHPVT